MQCRKIWAEWPMEVLLAGNDTVPISTCRGRGVRLTKCRLQYETVGP